MILATGMTVEVLHVHPETTRAREAIAALAQTVDGLDVTLTRTFTGGADWLLLWGPGEPQRAEALRRQVDAGGHAIVLDLAYWHRDVKTRLSIDAPHPQAWIMRRAWPLRRLLTDAVPMGDVWNPEGPILVAGIGPKASVQYGPAVLQWEAEMIAACERRWRRPVLYRPKRDGAPVPPGVRLASMAPIDRVLAGCSLVITWHSNVAVDAIRLGIPVICRDGAAAAVCPSSLEAPDDPRPLSTELRSRFLANLAWFQWAPNEAAQTWAFIAELLA